MLHSLGPNTKCEYSTRVRGYSHLYIWVCAAVKGMVFKKFSLGEGVNFRVLV